LSREFALLQLLLLLLLNCCLRYEGVMYCGIYIDLNPIMLSWAAPEASALFAGFPVPLSTNAALSSRV